MHGNEQRKVKKNCNESMEILQLRVSVSSRESACVIGIAIPAMQADLREPTDTLICNPSAGAVEIILLFLPSLYKLFCSLFLFDIREGCPTTISDKTVFLKDIIIFCQTRICNCN